MAQEWFCEVKGQLVGPLESADLRRMAKSGELLPANKIRQGDHGQWVEARRVKGLFDEQPAQAKTFPTRPALANEKPPALMPAAPRPTDDAVASWMAAPATAAMAAAPVADDGTDWDSFDPDESDDDAQSSADLLAAATPQPRHVAKPVKTRTKTASGINRWFLIGAYWTPRLVRFSWALAVGLAILAMLVAVALYILGVIFGLDDLFFGEGLGSFARGFWGATVSLVMVSLSIWLALYAYRLSCEFLIVVFDIAETLASIREELRKRP